MILRRRDDTFERVIREHLGGALFAMEGYVDRYFEVKCPNLPLTLRVTAEKQWKPLPSTLQLWRIQESIDEHIRSAREREFAALRRANLRQACLAR